VIKYKCETVIRNLHIMPVLHTPIFLSEVLSKFLGWGNQPRQMTHRSRFWWALFCWQAKKPCPRKSERMSMQIPFDFLGRGF